MARHLVLIPVLLVSCASEPTLEEGGATDASSFTDTSSTSDTAESATETPETDTSEAETDASETETETETETSDTGEPFCGDGSLDSDEECDDGNSSSFDGCSGMCTIEPLIERLSVGASHACVLTPLGAKCWGGNGWGQLGLGDGQSRGGAPDEMGVDLPWVDAGMDPTSLEVGGPSSCAIGPSGLACWGRNSFGQLGLGDVEHRGDEPGEMGVALPMPDLGGPVQWVTVGSLGACAKLEQGLKCWGRNEQGHLGLGDSNDRGDEPGEMGDALPFVDLGMDAVQVALDGNCARDEFGRVKCWGANLSGTLGLGEEGNRGDEPGEMGDALPFVDLGLDVEVIDISAMMALQCAVLSTGGMKCWGNTHAPWADAWIWPGAEIVTGDEPGEMGDALPELTSGDERAIVEVAVGYVFVCARLDDGAVRCVGRNEHGQLGNGNTEGSNAWFEDIPDTDLGEPAIQIGAGRDSVCALLASGNVKCWGCGSSEGSGVCGGGLGYGDEEQRGDEPGEMGDALPYVELF